MTVRDIRRYFFVESYCIYSIYDAWGTVIKENVPWSKITDRTKDGKIHKVSVTKINFAGSIVECEIFMHPDFVWRK